MKWHLQFSIRAMLLVFALVSICFGLWRATARYAEHERESQLVDTYSIAPCVIYRDKYDEGKRRYYLWLFGPTVALPYSEQLPQRDNAATFP